MAVYSSKSYYDPILDAMVQGVPGKGPQPTKAQISELNKLNVKQAQSLVEPTPVSGNNGMGAVTRGEYDTIAQAPAPIVKQDVAEKFPAKGTIVGYEYAPNKTMRKPQIADGNGGTTAGSWEKNPDYVAASSPGDGGGGGGGAPLGGVGGGTDTATAGPTTSTAVLKSMLKGLGFSASLVDSSSTFLSRLLNDGLDYDNAVQVFLNAKDYTFKKGDTLTSPFYDSYGYLNDKLTKPKAADELFNAVEGYKEVKAKYNLSDKFIGQDAIMKYVKNGISVAMLDERANMARLKAVNADAAYTDTLKQLGFIKDSTDLTDFFMDPEIGQQQLELNRNLAAFSTEAVRRAKANIKLDAEKYRQIVAGMTAKGLTEEQISAAAATGFENIAGTLNPLVATSGMFERGAFGTEEQRQAGIQSELVQEEFGGTASERRKRLAEQNVRSFQGSAGTISSMYPTLAGVSLRKAPTAGIL